MLLKDLQNHVLAIKNLCFSSHHITQLANLFDELSFFLLDLVGNKSSVTVSLLLLVQSYVLQYMVLHSVADISQAWPSDRGTQLTDQKSIVGHLFLLLSSRLQYHLSQSGTNPHQMVSDIWVSCVAISFIRILAFRSLVNLAH
jgi:hypothetical protein